MGLDFIDISKADEQGQAHMPGAAQQSKSDRKMNKSVFLDINEDAEGDSFIYENEGVNKAASGGGSPVTRTAVRNPGKTIVNIDVSRTAERERYRSDGRRSRGYGKDRQREDYGEDSRRESADRRRNTGAGREQNPAPSRRRNSQSDRNSRSDRNPQSDRNSRSNRNPQSSGNPRNRRNAQESGRERRAAQEKAQREREIRRRRRRRQQITAKLTVLVFMVSMVSLLLFVFIKLVKGGPEGVETVKNIDAVLTEKAARREVIKTNKTQKPIMEEDFLTVNEYSRPGEKLEKVNNIFVHYTANKGTSAAQNRSYFENLGITGETSASAHFIIGFDGEIIQCIPLEEIAYAVQKRNYDSVSIECCYLQDNGEFTEATYQSLIRLSAWLLNEYNLAPEDMRRHYDEGGKKCPLYYVENEDAWEQFLKDLRDYIMAGEAWEAGESN